ncbi:MAG: hypothetical protein ACI86X_000859 [Moritella sp.]|jgi:hypothetical protein
MSYLGGKMRICLIVTALLSGSVFAASPELSIFAQHQPLSDSELAAMSGKYTVSGQEYYFGLQLQTTFLQSNGISRHVQMQVELDVSTSPTVAVRVGERATPTAEPLQFTTLNQHSGLQQRIQVAGSQNYATNDLDMQQGRLTAAGNAIPLGQTAISTDNSISFSAVPGGLGYQVSLPAGLAEQGLIHSNNKGLLLQGVRIDGANHNVINRASIRYDGVSLGSIKSQILQRQLHDVRRLGL